MVLFDLLLFHYFIVDVIVIIVHNICVLIIC